MKMQIVEQKEYKLFLIRGSCVLMKWVTWWGWTLYIYGDVVQNSSGIVTGNAEVFNTRLCVLASQLQKAYILMQNA